MEIEYGTAPVDLLPKENRANTGRAPKGEPHASMFQSSEPREIPEVVQVWEQVHDGKKHRSNCIGGCPRPLRRVEQ